MVKDAFFPSLPSDTDVIGYIKNTTTLMQSYRGDTYYNQFIAYSLSKDKNEPVYKGSYDILKKNKKVI